MKTIKINQFFKRIITILLISSLVSCFNDDNNDDDDDDNNDSKCINTSLSDAEVIAHNVTGTTFNTNLVSLFHNNINVIDLEISSEFYEFLGFNNLFGPGVLLPIDITDPEEALGINLEPYNLDVAIIQINDGFVIDLIQYNTPFDDEAPNGDIYDLGFSALHLKTDNLLSDIAAFDAKGIEYTLIGGTEESPTKISFTDPSGTILILTEVATDVAEYTGFNSSGQTSIYGLFTSNINVSNLNAAIEFYSEVGFNIISENENIATISMPDGRHFTLTESCNTEPPYEDANHLGIARAAIVTSDIDADIERLTAAGIVTYTPEAITPAPPLDTLKYIAFEDPDGTIIELIELLTL